MKQEALIAWTSLYIGVGMMALIRDAHLRFGGGTKCPDLVNQMVVRAEKAAPAAHERDMLERLCAMGDALDENAASSLVSIIRNSLDARYNIR